jgi:hypothetical protein
MRGFETHKGYDMRLVYDAPTGEFKWQRVEQRPLFAPNSPSLGTPAKHIGE